MRKIFLLFIFCIFSIAFSAEMIECSKEMTVLKYDRTTEEMCEVFLHVLYDEEDQAFWFVVHDGPTRSCFEIDAFRKGQFLSFLKKYVLWNKQAKDNQVQISKKIGVFRDLRMIWDDVRSKTYRSPDLTVDYIFASHTKAVHFLVFQFSGVTDTENTLITYKIPDLYLKISNIAQLRRDLNSKNIKKLVKEYHRQKSIEAKFK